MSIRTAAAVRSGRSGPVQLRILDTTSAVPLGSGIGSVALLKVGIQMAATAVTVTLAGFLKKSNTSVEAAQTLLLTGPDSDDAGEGVPFIYDFGEDGVINDGAAFTATCSVDESAWVVYRLLK